LLLLLLFVLTKRKKNVFFSILFFEMRSQIPSLKCSKLFRVRWIIMRLCIFPFSSGRRRRNSSSSSVLDVFLFYGYSERTASSKTEKEAVKMLAEDC